jgi:type II secretion system protein C
MILVRKVIVSYGVSTLVGVIFAMVLLIGVNAALLRIPDVLPAQLAPATQMKDDQSTNAVEQDYRTTMERNLFGAKLQIEIPRAKAEKEIEEETLTGIVKGMSLKGVMLGAQKRDNYAVIDRGGQKGVWTYKIGDSIEKGLALKEIGKDSIRLEKGGFAATLRLFSPIYERSPGNQPMNAAGAVEPLQRKAGQETASLDLGKDIKKEGSTTLISKSLAEKLKANNNMVTSSLAVKPSADGLKVVTVDDGSIVQRVGLAPDDTLQEVNGHKLNSSEDMNKVYEALKNETSFELRVLRRGKPETLRYEIR